MAPLPVTGGYDSPNAARAWAYLTSIAVRPPSSVPSRPSLLTSTSPPQLDAPLPLDTPIPDHAHAAFPLYAPSFTLDVPASAHRPDENTPAYLDHVERAFDAVVQRIQERVGAGAGAAVR